jgi:hypothetical protein
MSVEASDPDAGDTLSYAWYLDGVLEATGASGIALGADSLAVGDHTVEVAVSDGQDHAAGGVATHAFLVSVRAAPVGNRATTIDSTAPAISVRISAGSALNLSVTASDPEGRGERATPSHPAPRLLRHWGSSR